MVVRATPTHKKVPWHHELLSGTVTAEDAEAEARALIADPRDTIESVLVYSLRDTQFVTGYTKKKKGGRA